MHRFSIAAFVFTLIVWSPGCNSYVPGDAAYNLGHPEDARATYESSYKAGNRAAGLRLAEMYVAGLGGSADPKRGVAIYEQLAAEGDPAAEHDLGYCYEYGQGVTIDYQKAAQWYGKAAGQRYVPALYNLGTLYAKDRIVPEDDVEGLTLLIESAILSEGEPGEKAKFIRDDTPGHRSRLMARMNVEQIGVAQKQAEERAKEFRLEVNPKGSKSGNQ